MKLRSRSVAVVAMVCLSYGCAGGSAAPTSKTAQRVERSEESSARSRPEPRKATIERATAAAAAPSIAEDDVQAQVRALRKAIALYGQFIERAEHQPEMKDAVQRSKERIEDAEATIDFLLKDGR